MSYVSLLKYLSTLELSNSMDTIQETIVVLCWPQVEFLVAIVMQ
uniref:Uncharacterized protein n=1 Tax=Arundo donax TaxID=35708 RepID=A0A0A8ZFW3_ARUDO